MKRDDASLNSHLQEEKNSIKNDKYKNYFFLTLISLKDNWLFRIEAGKLQEPWAKSSSQHILYGLIAKNAFYIFKGL